MDIKDQEGLEIFLGYICNIKCNFCYQKDLRKKFSKNIEKIEVERLLREGIENKKKFVIFSGGEPTLDKNLGFYIELSKNLGYEHIRVHTNGWGFRDFGYLKDLYNKGLTGVIISVHGIGGVHNHIVKSKIGFFIIVKALNNFEKLKSQDSAFVIDTNTVISKDNFILLPAIILLFTKFSITRSQLVLAYSLNLYTPEEKVKILPKYEEILPFLIKAIKVSFLRRGYKVVLDNIPFCILSKKYWSHILSNLMIKKDSILIDKGINVPLNINWINVSTKCQDCIMRCRCKGMNMDYFKVYGDGILKTIYD